jgi:hypothetical protein
VSTFHLADQLTDARFEVFHGGDYEKYLHLLGYDTRFHGITPHLVDVEEVMHETFEWRS